jgi:hypothetical protein
VAALNSSFLRKFSSKFDKNDRNLHKLTKVYFFELNYL